ncbi:unnamed protein product, partial [Medioppia subpectinata]
MSVENMASVESTSGLRHKHNTSHEDITQDMTHTAGHRNHSHNEPIDERSEPVVKRPKQSMDLLLRTGGAYIPPARLRLMQKDITDKNSQEYQRISWEALKKSINGLINKVNVANIAIIVRELLKENLIRGRGLLCRSIISAQTASPTFTHVYATLVAIINSKAHEVVSLEILTLLLENATNDSVEVAIAF